MRQLSLSFAFPHSGGSPNYLAMEHLLDVGSLSGRAPSPVSDPLQAGLRFFQLPVPHHHRLSLRSACPLLDPDAGTTPASCEGGKIGRLPNRNDPGHHDSFRAWGGKIGSYPSSGGDTRFPRSASIVHVRLGACYQPSGFFDREGLTFLAPSDHFTFWFKPDSSFGLFAQ